MKSDTPSIRTEAVVLQTLGPLDFSGYLARPTDGHAPGLIIFSEMWGVTQLNRDMANAYARRGWCVLVPNMFWQSSNPSALASEGPQREMAWARLAAFDFNLCARDTRTAVDWLRARPFCAGQVAAIGFCMGGRIAFLAGARGGCDAAIAIYALGIAEHLDELRTIPCPLQMHYGLSDIHISRDEINTVTTAAHDNSNVEIFLYPAAGHGFFNPDRATHHLEAVTTANERIDQLLATVKGANSKG